VSALPSIWASAASAAAPALRVLLRRRARRGKEIAGRLHEREGREAVPRPPGRLLWLHAASVGESVSILPVLTEIARQAPDVTMLLTTGTVTSSTLLQQRLPELALDERVLHRFAPLDVPRWSGRFLDHWRPDAAVLVESELWPNLIVGCRSRGIPVVLLNGRMSAASLRRWRFAPGLARELLGSLVAIQAQSQTDAERLRELGARDVTVPGNLKFAASPLPADASEVSRVREWLNGRPCWVAASTHPGEETIILDAHRMLTSCHPGLVTIVVPRHPERGAQIAAEAGQIEMSRRSLGQGPPAEGVWIGDTLGELGLWYRVAGVALIGRSLVPPGGGQNPLEAARLACPVATGPYTQNFSDAVLVLDCAGVLTRVTDAGSIAGWVTTMLRAPHDRAVIGARAQAVAAKHADLPRQIATGLLALVSAER
jgi:3-deoxy-D-manno-octulosonic-acid transferase